LRRSHCRKRCWRRWSHRILERADWLVPHTWNRRSQNPSPLKELASIPAHPSPCVFCPHRRVRASSSAYYLDNFEIPANGRNVAKVSYANQPHAPGRADSTTEHLLSALIGMGIDNVIIELDNLELPILDGSALPYVQAILNAASAPSAAAGDHPRAATRRGSRRQQVHRRLPRLGLQHPLHH